MNTVSSSVSDRLNHPASNAAFSSDHSGGAEFCFVDGSVRFIAQTVSCETTGLQATNTGDPGLYLQAASQGRLGVYQLLASRSDGQPLSGDSY